MTRSIWMRRSGSFSARRRSSPSPRGEKPRALHQLLDRERAKAQSHSPVLRLQPIQSVGRKALTQPAGSMILTQHQEKDEKNETSQF